MEKLAAATLEVIVKSIDVHKINRRRHSEHLTVVRCCLPVGSEPNVGWSWILLSRTQAA